MSSLDSVGRFFVFCFSNFPIETILWSCRADNLQTCFTFAEFCGKQSLCVSASTSALRIAWVLYVVTDHELAKMGIFPCICIPWLELIYMFMNQAGMSIFVRKEMKRSKMFIHKVRTAKWKWWESMQLPLFSVIKFDNKIYLKGPVHMM